jgi:type I restriction enzyme S subunit
METVSGKIVRVRDSSVGVTERNERDLDKALWESEALRKAILQKAFTGRLVPQDPGDEPATILLARLRAEGHGRLAVAPKPLANKRKRKNEPG